MQKKRHHHTSHFLLQLYTGVNIFFVMIFIIIKAFAGNGSLWLTPATGNLYTHCYYPIELRMNTDNNYIEAVDVKVFLNNRFDIHNTFLSGTFDVTNEPILEGISTTGDILNTTYQYISAYQSVGSSGLNTGNTRIATIYLKPNSDYDTGNLQYYFVPGLLGDDSNIISGTNLSTDGYFTKFTDTLGSVGSGNYSFITTNTPCPAGTITYTPPAEPDDNEDNDSESGKGNSRPTLVRDYCPDGDYTSSYYDRKCGNKPPKDEEDNQTNEEDDNQHDAADKTEIPIDEELPMPPPVCTIPDYSDELNTAYRYACMHDITTMPTIDDADMYGTVIRKHLAKMISQYAINVRGQTPDRSRRCRFDDMANQSDEMQYYATISCQLGLMGLQYDGTPATGFNGDDIVTRAQFGTVFSRLLFGDRFNGDKDVRYRPHLNALKTFQIMNNISDPTMPERRGYVMLMMYRSDSKADLKLLTENSCSPSGYPANREQAYKYACDKGITTVQNIHDANPTGTVIRMHYAKMVSQFAINELGMQPNTSIQCSFADMKNESIEMGYYAQTACQLGLMGLQYDGTPADSFDPHGIVNRAMAATILSRILFGDKYNTNPDVRYRPHMDALVTYHIISPTNAPLQPAVRGNVWLILYRAAQLLQDEQIALRTFTNY